MVGSAYIKAYPYACGAHCVVSSAYIRPNHMLAVLPAWWIVRKPNHMLAALTAWWVVHT